MLLVLVSHDSIYDLDTNTTYEYTESTSMLYPCISVLLHGESKDTNIARNEYAEVLWEYLKSRAIFSPEHYPIKDQDNA